MAYAVWQRLATAAVIAIAGAGLAGPASAELSTNLLPRGDHAMGSQIAAHEGTTQHNLLTQSSGDDPTTGVQGIDVSRWQGNVDWQSWWDAGKRFAYVKATEGTYNTSAYFDQQYNGSAAVGMIRGAYHFAIPSDSTGAAQANFFVANGGSWTKDGKTLPGVIDLEYNPYDEGLGACYGKTHAEMVAWITNFVDTYRGLTGRFPVIYTTRNWWTQCVDSARFGESVPLWIARWSSEVGQLPAGWRNWTFWQYTDNPLDQDKFSGTYSQLKELAFGPRPTAPRAVSAAGGMRRATLRWKAPRWAGAGGITKFRIDVSPGGKVVDDIAPSARSTVVTGLRRRTTYRFTLRAFSNDGAGSPARRRLAGVSITSSLVPNHVRFGRYTIVRGRAHASDSGRTSAGVRVVLQQRRKGTKRWHPVTSVATTNAGEFAFRVKPRSNRDYRVIYRSRNNTDMGSWSPYRTVSVRQAVRGSFMDPTVGRRATVRFSGKVLPKHVGRPVLLQRKIDGVWRTMARRLLNPDSRYRFFFRAPTPGTYHYRAVTPRHFDHAAGFSRVRKLIVR